MIGALAYLRLMSLRNRLVQRLLRLRQPKYLIGALAGCAYVWFFFIRPARMAGANGGESAFEMLPLTAALTMFALLAIVRVVIAWMAPDKPGLGFSEAEIAFLFPAPVTRRMLVHFKLLNSQLTILVSALIIALLARGWNGLGGNSLTHGIGIWLILSVFSLHTMGAALTIARLEERRVKPLHRQLLVGAVILVYLGALVYGIWQVTGTTPRNYRELLAATESGMLEWLVLPFRLLVAPFLAGDWTQFARSIAPALGILAAHYLWVLRSEVTFEEASIVQAEKHARKLEQLQAGRLPRAQEEAKGREPPFRLDPHGGRVETAFLWKNLLSTRPLFSARNFAASAALVLIVCVVMIATGADEPLEIIGAAGVIGAAYTAVLGPQVARQDLRGDLLNADLLKTYPLPGWQIVLGQLLAPTAILTCLIWLGLLPQVFALAFAGSEQSDPGLLATVSLSVALLVPFICFIQLMIPNGAVLLFPSWAGPMRLRDRGIDVMGQRLVLALGQMIVVMLALVPALLFGLLVGFAAFWVMPAVAATLIGAAGGLAILSAEIAAGVICLGNQFEKFDVSDTSQAH